MNFFEELKKMMQGISTLTLVITTKDDLITIGSMPKMKDNDSSEKMKMVTLTGTVEELEEGFFAEVVKPILALEHKGLVSNANEIATEIKKEVEEEDDKSQKTKDKKKSAPIKKAKPKQAPKKASSKPEPKKSESKAKATITPKVKKVASGANKIAPDANTETAPEKINAMAEEITPAPIAQSKDETREKFDGYMADGKELFIQKKYREAQIAFQNALVFIPAEAEALKEEKKAGQWAKAYANLNTPTPIN